VAWSIHQGAALQRVNKMPSLDRFMRPFDDKLKRAMTPDEVRRLLEQMGGVSSDG